MEYTVKYSPKKSAYRLEYDPNVGLVITVPNGSSDAYVSEILRKHRRWIANRADTYRLNPPLSFRSGEQWPYFGVPHSLAFADSCHDAHFKQGQLILPAALIDDPTGSLKAVRDLYLQASMQIVAPRAEHLARQSGLTYARLRFNFAETAFGTCNADNRITLHAGLPMFPPAVIDYVILHELCHTVHKNHSAAFWQCVETHLPEYRTLRRQCKDTGHLLKIFSPRYRLPQSAADRTTT